MSGRLSIIGTGPGNPEQMTPEALAAAADAAEFFGYGPYLDRLSLRADQIRHASDNREELDRAKAGRAAGRPDECIVIARLADAEAADADMATCVIIGSAETRVIARDGKPDLVYTPRFIKDEAR
jgi:precorrin-3B methylase